LTSVMRTRTTALLRQGYTMDGYRSRTRQLAQMLAKHFGFRLVSSYKYSGPKVTGDWLPRACTDTQSLREALHARLMQSIALATMINGDAQTVKWIKEQLIALEQCGPCGPWWLGRYGYWMTAIDTTLTKDLSQLIVQTILRDPVQQAAQQAALVALFKTTPITIGMHALNED